MGVVSVSVLLVSVAFLSLSALYSLFLQIATTTTTTTTASYLLAWRSRSRPSAPEMQSMFYRGCSAVPVCSRVCCCTWESCLNFRSQ
uniref:Putative secreted peptide n=1 Tax=Anopheles braziliensis TaxID=58242 RepID=A0A2M3ZQD9_9DIPT